MSALPPLYAITPDEAPWKFLEPSLEAAFDAGVRLLQYRRKHMPREIQREEASRLMVLAEQVGNKADRPLIIINDDVALAHEVGADGVHWGRDDANPESLAEAIARARHGTASPFLVGISCYNELARARAATEAGADYVAFGAVFASPTKPQAVTAPLKLFSEAASFGAPAVAIGGINQDNAAQAIAAGAASVAVISALFATLVPQETAARVRALHDVIEAARINA